MPTKNLGPCLIIGSLAYEKCQRKRTLEAYPYLENTFASSIDMLTKALYYQQRREGTNLELDPVNFERMIETINPGLKGFFNFMTEAIIPKECSAYSINEAKKSIVGLCYLIAGLRNKFVNQHKLEVGLYLRASGPLHVSLNSREQVIMMHHPFFEKLFYFVFGKKKLAKKPRPWRVNLLLELARNGWLIIKDKIIEKFGRACKNIEYRAIVDLFDNLVPATLDVYAILFQSEKDVDLRHLPTSYSTAHPPRPGLCDSCGRSLVDENGMVFVCGHGYHNNCYNGKCKHCEEFYKKGIFKNVQKFLTRIEKGADTLTEEDLNDDDDDEENVEEESEEVEEVDISPKLIEEMNQI
ncbi:hypothetical protein C2G38_2281924 [Gigaspora rosea]|uniref:Uncharacterized protein n=1 Tax=Gigaspora rosea TaxID=44941 RepID=A0A397U7J6_9GLOM|nr:hypothetical protein C2G38_2281924 [Gigaspora rosea]